MLRNRIKFHNQNLIFWFIVTCIIIGSILFTYKDLPKLFFQQDEWMSLGLVQADGVFAVVKDLSFIELLGGKYRVLGTVINNAFHVLYPFSPWPFVIFALVVHSINSLLTVGIIKKFSHPVIAILAGLLFTLAYTPSQSLLWFSAHITTLGSVCFALLALTYSLQSSRKQWLLLLLTYISFLFKESSGLLFLILPLIESRVHKKGQTLQQFVRYAAPYMIMLGIIAFIRFASLFGAEGSTGGAFVTGGSNSVIHILPHTVFYPLLGFGHVFIGTIIIRHITEALVAVIQQSVAFGTALQIQYFVNDFVSISITLFTILVAWVIGRKTDKKIQQLLFIGILFALLNFLPYSVVFRLLSPFFESRYYYLSQVGIVMVYAGFMQYFLSSINKKYLTHMLIVLVFIFSLIVFKQSQWISRELKQQVITSEERKLFLEQLSLVRSTLPNNPVFYISGDSPGMYGISNLSVPFQQGMGYTVMVWLFDTGTVPKELLRQNFLWNINAQGYQVYGYDGFGYYWNKQRLQEDVHKKLISTDQIIALYYRAGEKRLETITKSLLQELEE